ncbi:hypothetical protein OS176_11400 [Xanthomonadaceae bacterium XH05]|nr:hypothetical protein [Xanthomonadaceae bacterium XH05]
MSIGKVIMWCVLASSAFATQVQAQDEAALREAERLGMALFELDRAVQAAQEAGQELRAFRRDDDVQGWVAERAGDGSHAIMFVGATRNDEIVGRYRVSVNRSGHVFEEMERLDDVPLNDRQQAQFLARQRAASVEHTACSGTYDTVVLADTIQGASGWRAYLLPRAAFPDVHLLGGTYRADLNAQGTTVRYFQPLASGCSVLQNVADAPALQFADEAVAGPNELHVYISQRLDKPLYVSAGGGENTWLIQDGRIRAVQGVPGQ